MDYTVERNILKGLLCDLRTVPPRVSAISWNPDEARLTRRRSLTDAVSMTLYRPSSEAQAKSFARSPSIIVSSYVV